MKPGFELIKKFPQGGGKGDEYHTGLARVGTIKTPHGDIQTPAFIAVGTKATVKALTVEDVHLTGAQAVLANTYHLYLEPGHKLVDQAGGFGKFMNWNGPTFTDSGGFQVFSLGQAYGKGVSKVATTKAADLNEAIDNDGRESNGQGSLVDIDEDGVTFKSHIDGSSHRFTPELSMDIQHALGADIFFAFDECTSPMAPHEYQLQAVERTHRWAQRSLDRHLANNSKNQMLFGVVQGGQHEDLRRMCARHLGSMPFDGFGIGGSFTKKDIDTAVGWVCSELPENKPRHLLGIGEPIDIFGAIENGVDTFDCVAPTRIARNGTLYTNRGKINIRNAEFAQLLESFDATSSSPIAQKYTAAYLAHLFRSHEMLAATLASIHNLHFIISLVEKIRLSLLDGTYTEFKKKFLADFYSESSTGL
jgi:queuine tRNA-ribosyltransferase